MLFDCFISHQHEDINYVESLANELESRGLKCWYAPRNVVGKYAKAIVHGISHSKVFLLILNSRSITSEAVLDELEMAHNIAKNTPYCVIQPVFTEFLDYDDVQYHEAMLYIRRLQFVHAENTTSISEVVERILEKQPQLRQLVEKRSKSQYVVQEKEDIRLERQNQLLDSFDLDIYQRVWAQYDSPKVLDVGCGTGDMLASRFGDSDFGILVGFDRSKRQIETAKIKHGSPNRYYYEVDIESPDFSETLESIKNSLQIKHFDIVNVSMVLLHVQDPEKLLSILRSSISNHGTIIIRDIDDGINFAYPDPDNAFARIYKMCYHDTQSGYRHNGRKVFSDLINAGYSEVSLERQGMSTIGMTNQQKETLFSMYFPFILENAKIMMDNAPWNIEYQEDYCWYQKNFDQIHSKFSHSDFVFSLGFMVYTAKP